MGNASGTETGELYYGFKTNIRSSTSQDEEYCMEVPDLSFEHGQSLMMTSCNLDSEGQKFIIQPTEIVG